MFFLEVESPYFDPVILILMPSIVGGRFQSVRENVFRILRSRLLSVPERCSCSPYWCIITPRSHTHTTRAHRLLHPPARFFLVMSISWRWRPRSPNNQWPAVCCFVHLRLPVGAAALLLPPPPPTEPLSSSLLVSVPVRVRRRSGDQYFIC